MPRHSTARVPDAGIDEGIPPFSVGPERAPDHARATVALADNQVAPRVRRSPYTYCVAATSLTEIEPHVTAWEDLEQRALDDNFYFTARVMIAALRCLRPSQFCVAFVYERRGSGDQLIACAPLTLVPPSLAIPVPAVATFESPQTYASHPLLDRDAPDRAISALWDWLEDPSHAWRLIMLKPLDARSRTRMLVLDELMRRGRRYWVKESHERAILQRSESFDDYLSALPPSRRKRYHRLRRRLEGLGTLEIVSHSGADGSVELAERFMTLEAAGWKGERGTALLQDPMHAEFFVEVTARAAGRGRLLFVELRLNGRPIAMTCNFSHGQTLFAFKIAYDPVYHRYSPGVLAEFETVRIFHQVAHLRTADSGVMGESYLDSYWQQRTTMEWLLASTGHYASEAVMRVLPAATLAKREVGQALRRIHSTLKSEDP